MAINPNNYDHRGGGNYGIILRCPRIVASDWLVYFDHNKERGSWVIRDFISGLKLDNNNSPLSVSSIEADATYDEFPAWCGVETNPGDWRVYLTLRTTAMLRVRRELNSTATPNPASGNWRPI